MKECWRATSEFRRIDGGGAAGREGTAITAARKAGKEWCDWEEEKEWAGERESDGREEMSERKWGGRWAGLVWFSGLACGSWL